MGGAAKKLRDGGTEDLLKALGAAVPVAIQGITAPGVKPSLPQAPAMGASRGFAPVCEAFNVHDGHAALLPYLVCEIRSS
jgi:hypothetical protein